MVLQSLLCHYINANATIYVIQTELVKPHLYYIAGSL